MDLTAVALPVVWQVVAWVVAIPTLLVAARLAPWHRFGASEIVHVWYGAIFGLVLLWSIRATVGNGFTFHPFAQVSGGTYAEGQAANANRLVYRGKYNPYSVGATPRNTPDFTFNLWTTYRFMPSWRAGVGIEGKGSRLACGIGQCDSATENTNTVSGPITPARRAPRAVPPASCVPT